MLEQGAVFGSLILPVSGEQTDNVEGFTTRDGQLFERLTGVPGAPYFVALAARAPIPAPPQSVLHADFYHEQIESRFAAIEHARQEQAEAHSQYAQQMADAEASLRAELAALQDKVSIAAQREQQMADAEASLRAELAALQDKVSIAAQREQQMADAEASLRAELAALQDKVSIAAQREQQMADAEASLRAELAALQDKVSIAAQREQQMADAEASLRAELAALQDKVSIAAQREQQMAERHAGQVEQMQGAMNILHTRLASQEREATKHDHEIAEHRALVSKLHEQMVRRLTSFGTARKAKLPRELRGIGRLISKRKRHLARDYSVVASSPLFDRDWYLQNNLDVAAMQLDPVLHYLRYGAAEGRQPGPLFNSRQYALVNPDVAAAKMNPLLHFLKYGAREGRALKQDAPLLLSAQTAETSLSDPRRETEEPSEPFDPQFYLARYPDVEAANVSPLIHFQEHGRGEGRRGVPAARRLTFDPLKHTRQPILVICHEASRTGAPILG